MRKVYGLALVSVLALGGAQSASAQEVFSGPRVEATIGWDQLRFDLGGTDARAKESDLGYGFAAGYDQQLSDTLIVGVEGAVTFSDADYATGDLVDGTGLHAKRELGLFARVGTPLGQNGLLYGKLGYTNLRMRSSLTADSVTTSDTKNLDGVAVGVGAEVGIGGGAYLKSEYRYSNYQDGFAKNDILTGVGIRF